MGLETCASKGASREGHSFVILCVCLCAFVDIGVQRCVGVSEQCCLHVKCASFGSMGKSQGVCLCVSVCVFILAEAESAFVRGPSVLESGSVLPCDTERLNRGKVRGGKGTSC